jgi:hypothetical protein
MSDAREELLEAHVQFELSRMRGSSLDQLIALRGEAWISWLAEAKLGQLATRAQVLGVIDRYVIELRVGGGITELAGEMSRAVFASAATSATRLDQVLSAESYAEFADKVESLGDARRGLVELISRSPSLADLVARVVWRIAVDMLLPLRAPGDLPGSGPFARLREPLLSALEARLGPMLSAYVERRAEHVIETHREQLVDAIGADGIRAVADDLFAALSSKRLSDSASVFSAQDLEDFVVLGYEFWLKFRKTDYFRRSVAEVVDKLFEKYGDESLVAVLEDLGIDAALLLDEVKGFAGPVVALARESGFLEQRIRAALAPFYASAQAAAIVNAARAPA